MLCNIDIIIYFELAICSFICNNEFVHIADKPFDCLAMAEYLKKDLPSLSNLPYKNMKIHLVANDVITTQEKKEIDKLTGEDQMFEVFCILQVSLKNKQVTKFKGFLHAMEQSGDRLLEDKAKSLGKLTCDTHLFKLMLYLITNK